MVPAHASQKFIHAISPTPASTMSSAEISMKSTNTTLSPYTFIEKATNSDGAVKRPPDSESDSQYWRYDVSKRQKVGASDGDRLCFKFISSGSCSRGEKCHFRHDEDAREQSMRGVCFDFLNKGKCERGPDCNFKHSLQDERESVSNRRPGTARANLGRFVFVLTIIFCDLGTGLVFPVLNLELPTQINMVWSRGDVDEICIKRKFCLWIELQTTVQSYQTHQST